MEPDPGDRVRNQERGARAVSPEAEAAAAARGAVEDAVKAGDPVCVRETVAKSAARAIRTRLTGKVRREKGNDKGLVDRP
jgi:hypothetical protein